MADLLQQLWDRTLQPRLRAVDVDVNRHPPPPETDWRERAIDSNLSSRGSARVRELAASSTTTALNGKICFPC